MKVIGHRGAAGLALENTIESIKAAKLAGVDAVEFDVRLTSDGHFVLCHDDSLGRVSKHDHHIKEVAAEHIDDIKLHNGEKLPTLVEALEAVGETTAIVEAKGNGWAKPLAKFLKAYAGRSIVVISFNHTELSNFLKIAPSTPVYAVERTSPFEVIQIARQNHLTGIDMNFWLLNPLTYWIARRKNLEIIVYTVNYRFIAWFLSVLFPRISITTDHPHLMQFVRNRPKKRLTIQPNES